MNNNTFDGFVYSFLMTAVRAATVNLVWMRARESKTGFWA